jgi:predicted transglutaminase-like cysteine proteinase
MMREQVQGLALGLGALLLAGCQTVPNNLQPAALGAPTVGSPELMSSTSMPEGKPADAAPPGFISFCSRFADQCAASSKAATVVHLDVASQAVLDHVNRSVNHAIRPEDDQVHYGRAEYWDIPTDGFGNCKDYALTKRRDLINAGLSERALRIAIVITPRNNRHAVLTVVTDRGDLVLDNLTDDIKPWTEAGYQWIARQDGRGELGWVTLASRSKYVTRGTTAQTE